MLEQHSTGICLLGESNYKGGRFSSTPIKI